jgi:hypothetical protein
MQVKHGRRRNEFRNDACEEVGEGVDNPMPLQKLFSVRGPLLGLGFQLRLVLFDEVANLVRHRQQLCPLFLV